ncbi:MAG TPA: sirohydrochlorin chelatase [Sporichthya sp.]|nr:sirohydrochlorin chelatase [Sporichthya sp.]
MRFRTQSSAPALIAVAHGSRNPAAQANIRALLAAVRAARPGLDVREAYIELASPLLPEVLADLAGEAVVVPLLLGNGYHIAHDVAGVADFHRPGTPCAPALGPDPLLVEALADRLAESCGKPTTKRVTPSGWFSTDGGAVVLAVAGSSDPRSYADAEATAAMLAERIGRPVIAAYNTSTTPSVVQTVAALRAAGHARVSVATYLLSPGRFASEVQACGADVVSAPLGVHPALVELVLQRYAAALSPSCESRPATRG